MDSLLWKRIPSDEREVFAMGFMIAYIGWAPDELVEAFPEETFKNCPEFIDKKLAHFWNEGYDSGMAMFCSHALDEEGDTPNNNERLVKK
tara:strand:+ start:2283 stop:2552 length:270 start_codon:yes stop_codon:yes gene_type:complete